MLSKHSYLDPKAHVIRNIPLLPVGEAEEGEEQQAGEHSR